MTSRPIAGRARAWLGSVAILMLVLATWPPPAAAASAAVVSGTGDLGLWLKAAPDFAAARVALLAEGTPVQVLTDPQPGGNDRAWAEIRAGDDTGWVVADFLAFTHDEPAHGLAPGGWARVTGTYPTTGLRLRAAPAPWETLLKILPEDTVVRIVEGPATGENGNPWYRVEAAGTAGWVDGSYLVAADAPAPPTEAARRTGGFAPGGWVQVISTYPAPGLRLRAGPAPSEALLAILPEGTKLRIIAGPRTGGDGDPWYQVAFDGATGWVSGAYLTPTVAPSEAAPPADATGARGAALVAAALKHLGKPYGWGATGPDRFDCSGFTGYVVGQVLGIALPRTSQQQAFSGTHVDRQDLIPGDLVFFADTYEPGVTHVGFYVGNNHWISAQDESTGVIVSSLDDPYWGKHYYGARRVT